MAAYFQQVRCAGWSTIIKFFLSAPIFSFNLFISCRDVTKFYKNCPYFATTVRLSQTATAWSRSLFHRLRLHNTGVWTQRKLSPLNILLWINGPLLSLEFNGFND